MKYEFINVKEVFNRYKVINVPYYQRDYVWGSKNDGRNLYKFIDDIFTQYKDNPSSTYFIGTLAFCSEKVNDVIDGQQRITSLVLILAILAKTKCSQTKKAENLALINPDGKFVIQEEYYLTEELKHNLELENNFNSQGYNVNISKTVDRIKNQIERAWSGYQEIWYDALYDYILNNVKLISLEYSNISESLKYFLNINSLSIQLTQSDIFFSILSQSIRISNSTQSIFTLKQKVDELGNKSGINKDLDDYKAYDQGGDKGTDNVIYIFLNAYFQKDQNIDSLKNIGIGKWISFYKNEVFNDQLKAKDFTDKFVAYLNDFETIYSLLANLNPLVKSESSLYLAWILLQYESWFDMLKTISIIFKTRHNYILGNCDLYRMGSSTISEDKLDEIAKRLNLTIIWNYIRSGNKRLDGFITNIEIDNSTGKYKVSVDDIISNMEVSEIFNLNYNDKKAVSNVKIKDESRIIKVIMALQEAYLNNVANDTKDFNEYLKDILTGENFSIEHLYSIKEHDDKERLANWQSKKNMFYVDTDFDTERFKFENLSLLDKACNSSVGTDEISGKLAKYKNARKVSGSEWEYLIQSLAQDSEYYKNEKIQALGLPDRALINLDQNTWELSPNNRDFNTKLLKMALEKVSEK